MKTTYKYTVLALLALFAVSCSGLVPEDKNGGSPGQEIQLQSSAGITADVETRAVEDFPNNGSIGIIAATTYDPEYPRLGWNTYTDINNEEATASALIGDTYSFSWRNQKYWPFDGSDLYFMAYSPIANGSLIFYVLSDDRASIQMGLDLNLPDIMYASGNTNPQPYNKNRGTVSLGEFRHILSKLTVRVVADNDMSPNIEISRLAVSTNLRSASFPLYGGDDALIVTPAPERYEAVLISGNTHFKTQPFSSTMHLFPGTQDDVQISITLVDTSNGTSFSADYMVSFFTNTEGTAVTLERAQNTVLTLNVLTVGVQNPDRNISLEGAITDWDYRGDFGVSIQ